MTSNTTTGVTINSVVKIDLGGTTQPLTINSGGVTMNSGKLLIPTIKHNTSNTIFIDIESPLNITGEAAPDGLGNGGVSIRTTGHIFTAGYLNAWGYTSLFIENTALVSTTGEGLGWVGYWWGGHADATAAGWDSYQGRLWLQRNISIFSSHGISTDTIYCISDDRIKHNEVDISGSAALSTIRKLNPQLYQKTTEMYAADFRGEISGNWHPEIGLIAQDVKQIPEVAFCVGAGDYTDASGNLVEDKYVLNYESIYTLHIAATKELDQIVQSQQQTILDLSNEIVTLKQQNTNLQTENATIKAALNVLLTAAGEPNI